MDGFAATGTLTPRLRHGSEIAARRRAASRFVFAVAGHEDDQEIRQMLRETAFPGSVRLSLEREPDSLAAGQIEGDRHQIIVARERTDGSLVAVASRSSRERFVNGQATRVGYFGQLRMKPPVGRRRDLLAGGFEYCRSLHERDNSAIYLASVISDNRPARRLLERGMPGWPTFRLTDRLVTYAIPAGGAPRSRNDRLEIVRGDDVDPALLAAFLMRNSRRYQFAPCWTVDDLTCRGRLQGLRPGDFLVAARRGSLAGCAAIWDQRELKQVIVRGYSRSLALFRPLINMSAPLSGAPYLPPAGTPLRFAHLSHLAIEEDDPRVLVALLGEARRVARRRGLTYLAVGLSASGPFVEPVRQAFAHRRYESVLYVAFWPDGRATADALDGRPSHPETAVL